MDAFVARQAILDGKLRVFGYELLFRSGIENSFAADDPDVATSRVISTGVNLAGIDAMTSGRTAFINVTRDFLVQDLVGILPPSSTVVEILESVEPDRDVVRACRELRARGYRIALDDFRPGGSQETLLAHADFVKLDVLALPPRDLAGTVRRLREAGKTLVAEKVETHEAFDETRALGCDYFQGYFFARPVVLSYRDIPASRLHYFEFLKEARRPDFDRDRIQELIEGEVALSYKLLRYIRSAFFGWRGSVRSIRHALLLLGEREIRNWISVVAIAGMAGDRPGPLLDEALVRSRFCALLAENAGLGDRASDLFLMGMFSMLEAILDQPLPHILDQVPLEDDVKASLLGGAGPLRDVLDVVLAYVSGDWNSIEAPAARRRIDVNVLPGCYEASVAAIGSLVAEPPAKAA